MKNKFLFDSNTHEPVILGIETSCDDTSICVMKGPKILAMQSFNHELAMKRWGGVVPELVARGHVAKLGPLLEVVFENSQLTSLEEVDIYAVTTHPGLLGPLLSGLQTAKTLALYFKRPIVPVNHLYAHLEAIHLTEQVSYPYMGLLVSGGNGVFFWVKSSTEMIIVGNTTDDAPGEAFDKGGKIMGLGYPAGRIIDEYARQGGDPQRFSFPIGLKNDPSPKMSFSGVKTSLRLFLENWDHQNNPLKKVSDQGETEPTQDMLDIAASYQESIVNALVLKTRRAFEWLAKGQVPEVKINVDISLAELKKIPLVVGGGVACNQRLRKKLTESQSSQRPVFFVAPNYCTDNGAMVANWAWRSYRKTQVPFPECLGMDAHGRFVPKDQNNAKKSHNES
jgi:N6-L-threonylcarbamoyladenine synthase